MDQINETLRKTRTSTSGENTDTWSSAEEANAASAGCPVCKGAGFVHPRLPSGKPDYGQVVPCECARHDLDRDRRERLARYSNLGTLSRFTFDRMDPQGKSGSPRNRETFNRACEAAKAFAGAPAGWLVLLGPSGSGKTHLAAAIVNERVSHGQPALYLTAADLLDHLRSTYSPESDVPYDEFFEQVRNAPLLVLDDLGVQSSTAWAQEKLDQILTYRFNAALPTVIATYRAPEQLDERLRTRLMGAEMCGVYRLEETADTQEYAWGPEFELQKTMTFTSFDWRRVNLPPEQRENLAEAYRLALEFAKAPEGWLVFMGETGCGKTHLAAAIVNYRYQAHQPALFVVVPEFLDHLRSAFSPESKVSYDSIFERVKKAALLVMDDFGEQSTTPWSREKLYQVLNYRYNAQLPTVVTTRYSTEEIGAQFDGAISSRLIDPKISMSFNITVPDYRGDVRPARERPRRSRRQP
ncbi:MAG: ATP-binding protein [Chloroflexota bacterium]